MPAAGALARPRAFSSLEVVLLGAFVLDLLDLCLLPFRVTDNLLVFVPAACLTISFVLLLVRLLIHGGKLR